MPNNEKTNKYSVSAKQTFNRSLTRKDPRTGKSNYPTLHSIRIKTLNYMEKRKQIFNRNYK